VFNVWALDQQESAAAVPFYADILNSMWPKLLMNDPTWEKAINDRYLDIGRSMPLPPAAPAPSPAPTSYRAPAPAPPPGGSSTGSAASRQAPHHNTTPNSALLAFRDRTGGQPIKLIVKNAKDAGHPVPNNDLGDAMCVTFHCMGVCNSNCSRRYDHNEWMKGERATCRSHTEAEDARLLAWCQTAFPTQ
jgi:hypothetical protein